MPDLTELKELRAAGVKSAAFDGDAIVEVEFYEMSELERFDATMGEMSNYAQAAWDGLDESEKRAAIKRRTEGLLYGSS